MPARGYGVEDGQRIPTNLASSQHISAVVFSGHEIVPWYPSYHHEDVVGKGSISNLYVCSNCFKYTTDTRSYASHTLRSCEFKDEWPGSRCYAKDEYEIFEVDGEEHLLFAQNLSLFGRLFIENKSVCFDVSGFIYYILVENEQIVGFFSKEKLSWDNNNLACILVFPPYQARGNGKRLMAASYVMSKREGRLGGPERPLSEPGRKSYESFWARAVAESLLNTTKANATISDISEDTYIVAEDVSSVLRKIGTVGKRKDGSLSINKASIREWIGRVGLDMRPPLDADGFIAMSDEISDTESISDSESSTSTTN